MFVGLLGPFTWLGDDGAEIKVPARKERAVLAFLALRADSVVSTGQLEAVLWGDDPPKTARETLKTYISHLRRLLAESRIETAPGGYRLAMSPDDVDVTRFEQLLQAGMEALDTRDLRRAVDVMTEALSLWRGDPLPDLADHPLGMAEAARLWDLHRAGQERNFAARLALGHHAELVGDLETAIAAEPLRERLWQQLMLALYRSGRQAEALRAYQRLRNVLNEELGIEPNDEIKALEAAILNHDPDVNLPPARVTPAPAPAGQPLPGGNVTFLLTAVEDSTRLAQRLGRAFGPLLETHRRILRSVIVAFGGREVNREGDGLFAVFADAGLAINACLDAQRALIAKDWPDEAEIRVRMGLHTGIARPSEDGDYHAVAVHQAARICAAAHGGQVLMSADTARLVRHFLPREATLVDRGAFMLNGFDEPERIYQLRHPALRSVFPPLRASPAQSHNLPDLRLSFVGRTGDLQAIERLLDDGRLVTLVGPGGAGKTRLAVEFAARVASRFEGGVHLCDLSPQSEPSLVPAALAEALGVRATSGRDGLHDIAAVLSDQDALLLVDSCEHLVASVSEALDSLLSEAPNLHILTTSREPLGVTGERLWRLGPLDVPAAEDDLAEVRRSDAVQLFESRARLTQPTFTVTEANANVVGEICRELEGLPLSIELVAAQIASLPPDAILARLRDWPLALGTPSGATDDRHHNLEATVDWSYQLLDDDSRLMLRLLSVFANGFTIEAARAVAHSPDTLTLLTRLVDKSLVVWDPHASRYRILESIRTFARARLDEAGEAEVAGARHLAWCASLADELKSQSRAGGKHEAYDLFDRELDNFRVALDWAAKHSATETTRLAGAVDAEAKGPALSEWWLVAAPDQFYFDQVETDGKVGFPLVPLPRRFRLETERAMIGRRSVQRGIVPDIDLSAPPTDTGVSHCHALLELGTDGAWTITDPGSTNRTYLNDSRDPLPFDQPIRVSEDDRIHIGAWTTLRLHRVS
jgi:predicted ATPase/DNA-binding SARP family transcriptional activator/class 3 adenylate cyclase